MVPIEELSLVPFGRMVGVKVVMRVLLTLDPTDKTMMNHV